MIAPTLAVNLLMRCDRIYLCKIRIPASKLRITEFSRKLGQMVAWDSLDRMNSAPERWLKVGALPYLMVAEPGFIAPIAKGESYVYKPDRLC